MRNCAGDFKEPVRVGIVQSTWLNRYSDKIVYRCRDELNGKNVKSVIVKVPGAFNLQYGIQLLSEAHPSIEVYMATAVAIRGETLHADTVVKSAIESLSRSSEYLKKPIVCEVLICDSEQQLKERCSSNKKNRGLAAYKDIMNLLQLIEQYSSV